MTEESLFLAALEKQTVEERQAFLDGACGSDAALRARVQMLLEADARSRGILDRKAVSKAEQTRIYMPNEQPGTIIADRYKLLEEIGEGGMGTVWAAEQSQPVRRKVAIKLIKAGMDSKSVLARFEAERQALAVMDHPNIAKVLDGGLTESGRPYFVMEYVKGVPITEYCDGTRMSVSERLNLFVQVCSAVQHAHQKGIIHRDLKPSNILVAPYDDKPVPKVIDFGLAKATHQTLTERTLYTAHETVLGTPLYMSPEQAQLNNIDVDTRSDIYSLGVLLYELLTGTTPLEKKRFKQAAWDEVKRLIREEEPPRPSLRLSSTDTLPSLAAFRQIEPGRLTRLMRGELDWIVMKSLEKDRTRRYETANGFSQDIQRFLAGEPVQAAPPSTSYRLRKFARKYRGLLATIGAFALVLIGATTFSAWQAYRATKAESVARESESEAIAERNAANVARDAEATARRIAEEQRLQAEANFKKAREAVDEYFTTVSESKLLDVEGLQPLRKELLDAAARYYSDFLQIRGNDPSVRAEAASASFRIGWVNAAIGRAEEAVSAYRKAIAFYDQLVGDNPGNVGYQRNLAMAHGALGLQLGDLDRDDESLGEHRKALEIRHAMVNKNPNGALEKIDVARTHRNIGNMYRSMGKPTEALAEWEQAVSIARPLLDKPLPKVTGPIDLTGRTDPSAIIREDLASILLDRAETLREAGRLSEAQTAWDQGRDFFEALVRERPHDLSLRNRLADSYSNGSSLEYDSGRFEESHTFIQRSLELRQAMAAANPKVLVYRRALSEGLLSRAGVLTRLRRENDALDVYNQSIDVAESLLKEEPGATYTQNLLAQGLCGRACILAEAGKADEALPLARRAIEIMEPIARDQPRSVFHIGTLSTVLRSLGRAQAGAGSPIAALKMFERASQVDASLADRYPGSRFNQACSLALMIPITGPDHREALVARVLKTLRQAFDAGYANTENLRLDPDLESLRDREDFKLLMMELATAREPLKQ